MFAFANSLGSTGDEEHYLPGSVSVPGLPDVFIGSADLMHRNLIRRVEALVSLGDETQIQGLIALLDRSMSDEVATWHLGPDNTWSRRNVDENGEQLADLQVELITRQRKRLTLGR